MYAYSMPKILVTGANGFVGAHLITELRNNNYDVVAICGRTKQDQPTTDEVEYLWCDLANANEVENIDFANIDGVIHLAGLAAVGPSFDAPAHYIATNSGIEANLFQAALKQDAHPRFVIISTGALYSPSAELPLTESSVVIPSSPYAVSKLTQEQLAQYYTKRGFECVIARPFNHIGPGQGLGFLIPDIAQQIITYERGEQTEIKVGNLDAERDYTDVRDIARAYRLLYEKGVSGQIYNVCSGQSRSGHEILSGLLAVSNTNPAVIQDPARMRPADNPVIYGDHTKLTAATGWQPEIDIATTLHDVVEDWQNR